MKRPLLLLLAGALAALALAPFVAAGEERGSLIIRVPTGPSEPSKPATPAKPAAPLTRIEQPMAPGLAEALAKEGRKTYTYQVYRRFEGQGATRLQAVKIANRERVQAERALVVSPVLAWKAISYAVVSCKAADADAPDETYCAFGVIYELTSTEPAPSARPDPSAKAVADKAEKDKVAQAYLQAVMRGTSLSARKCPDGEGRYYVVGKRTKVSPEVVPCVDVHYRAQCTGSTAAVTGVAPNFIGFSTDCFMGDTAKINPTPACPIDQVAVSVVKVTACGKDG